MTSLLVSSLCFLLLTIQLSFLFSLLLLLSLIEIMKNAKHSHWFHWYTSKSWMFQKNLSWKPKKSSLAFSYQIDIDYYRVENQMKSCLSTKKLKCSFIVIHPKVEIAYFSHWGNNKKCYPYNDCWESVINKAAH
jgi:hypothetical protein